MKPKKLKLNWKLLILCLAIVYAFAFIGSLFTDIGNWYNSVKPPITPPNYVFPIVWTILFFLIALSFYLVLVRDKKKNKIMALYCINLVLNVLWSYLFFTLKSPLAAFIDILLLLVSIAIMITVTFKIDKKASYLLIPYLLWVLFAALLNYLIAF